MHKRLEERKDWPTCVYSLRAYPYYIPQALWDQARLMQNTWNRLIHLREKVQEETKDMEPAAKKERWVEHATQCRRLVGATTLNWECKDELVDRFFTASVRAVKGKGTLRIRHRLDTIMIPHRFTGGGLSIEKFFAQGPRAKRARIQRPDPAIYELPYRQRRQADRMRGVFGLDANLEQLDMLRQQAIDEGWSEEELALAESKVRGIEFVCHFHRPIPPGSIVKKVLWSGKRFPWRMTEGKRDGFAALKDKAEQQGWDAEKLAEEEGRLSGWEWHIQLVVEQPPPVHKREDSRVVGLDLGWRIMAEGQYVRIGMLADSDGRLIELRLPMNDGRLSHHKDRKDWYCNYPDLFALDEKIGSATEACKAALRKRLENVPAGFTLMRQSGLRRLLHEAAPEHAEVLPILAAWDREDRKWHSVKMGIQERLTRRRKILYQNLAKWLTTTYKTIAWEKELSVKQLAEADTTDNYALTAAGKYRQWAAIGDLRQWIKQACPKYGATLVDGVMEYSSRQCVECGHVSEGGAALIVECGGCQRKFDQDQNAAMHFVLAHAAPQMLYEAQDWIEPLPIPDVLKSMVVPCSLL